MHAANRPTIVVDAEEVPEEFRVLIPAVERWAIPCDVTRGDYFEKQPEENVAAFWYEVLPHVDAINEWLDAQPADVGDWSEAAVHFMYFLKAHSEAYQPTEEERRLWAERDAAWERSRETKQAVDRGLAAFRNKDYTTAAECLAPHADDLDPVATAKLRYALKKAAG